MKNILVLIILATFIFPQAQGQIALLDKVYDFIQRRELEKAESAILIAEKNVTTANDARTYYLKAFIYKDLFAATQENRRDEFRNTCWASLKKCKVLDHDDSFKQPLKQINDFIIASIYNDATEKYNKQIYQQSIAYFHQYIDMSQVHDTYWLDANYFIGSAYYTLQNLDSAKRYFQIVKDKNYDQPILFVDLSYLYYTEKNEEQAIKTIESGLKKYPEYFDLQIAQLNILAGFNRDSLLVIKAEEFLNSDPNNIEVLLMTATAYERTNKDDDLTYFHKAEKVYKKVIELDPKNFDANYNLGVLYYNEAVDIVNKNDFDTEITELTKILEKSTSLFENSLPLLLTIYESSRDNLKLLQALQAIYYNLNKKEELNEINTAIKKLSP
jgi:tetratricopeptide (TPR) repeat protein